MLRAQQGKLHQFKGNDVPKPAFLYFSVLAVLFLQHNVGIDLFCSVETLSLQNFQIHGDFCPLVVKGLVGTVPVHKGDLLKPLEYCIRNGRFLFADVERCPVVDKFGLEVRGKVCKGRSVFLLPGEYGGIAMYGSCHVLCGKCCVGRAVVGEQGFFQAAKGLPVRIQCRYLVHGYAAEHGGVNIPRFGTV